MGNDAVFDVLAEAKAIAGRYYDLTGKPLGITGEIAEYEAARLLGIELAIARQAGYDAIEVIDGMPHRLQIKGRCLAPGCKPAGQLGSIKTDKEWDAILMVLLDASFEAIEIWQADREAVVAALQTPGSKARNERGSLAIARFKSIGWRRWPAQEG